MTSSECHLKGDFCYTFQELCTANRIWKPFMAGAYEGNALMEGGDMYKNRASSGKNNISGDNIARIRKQLTPKVSQRFLADRMHWKESSWTRMRSSASKAAPDLSRILS